MALRNVLKIGDGYINKINEFLAEKNVSGNILFITGPNVGKLYAANVKMQLENIGRVAINYINDNTIAYAMNIASTAIENDVDYIVGMGGGRVLDVSKYAAYVSKRPFISIPTTLSNDGIASAISVLKRSDSKPKSLGCAMPSMVIIDTELIIHSPLKLIKAGIGDTISNYMALLDWEYACSRNKDEMNDLAYLMSRNALDVMMQTEHDSINSKFINVLADSIVLSGLAMEFAGSSRPVSGSEHLFSHALDYYSKTKNLHGIQVALGTVAVLKLLGFDYGNILNYLNKFEVNINPLNLGISKNDFVNCMQKAPSMRINRYTYLSDANFEKSWISRIYDELSEEL